MKSSVILNLNPELYVYVNEFQAQPDHVTPSNDAFAGGYGTDDSWCDYTGIFQHELVA